MKSTHVHIQERSHQCCADRSCATGFEVQSTIKFQARSRTNAVSISKLLEQTDGNCTLFAKLFETWLDAKTTQNSLCARTYQQSPCEV
eukprot:4737269-Amphidinium_carterae.2